MMENITTLKLIFDLFASWGASVEYKDFFLRPQKCRRGLKLHAVAFQVSQVVFFIILLSNSWLRWVTLSFFCYSCTLGLDYYPSLHSVTSIDKIFQPQDKHMFSLKQLRRVLQPYFLLTCRWAAVETLWAANGGIQPSGMTQFWTLKISWLQLSKPGCGSYFQKVLLLHLH